MKTWYEIKLYVIHTNTRTLAKLSFHCDLTLVRLELCSKTPRWRQTGPAKPGRKAERSQMAGLLTRDTSAWFCAWFSLPLAYSLLFWPSRLWKRP